VVRLGAIQCLDRAAHGAQCGRGARRAPVDLTDASKGTVQESGVQVQYRRNRKAVLPVSRRLAENGFSGLKPPKDKESGFTGLKSPKWPENILGPIDRRSQPKVPPLRQFVQDCHLPPVIPGNSGNRKLAASQRVRSAFPHVEVILIIDRSRTDPGAPESVRVCRLIRMTST